MRFFLFLLLNAVLFIRPSELVVDLAAVPIFNILILLTLAASGVALLKMLEGSIIREQPTVVCVVLLLPILFVTNAFRLGVRESFDQCVEFSKILVYFVLLISILDTPARLHRFLGWLAVFTLTLTIVALLNFYGLIAIQSLDLISRIDESDGLEIVQLSATGIYSDPNDLCSILNVAFVLALSRLCDRSAGWTRAWWVLPIGVFFWALLMTRSRGGFLGFLASIATLLYFRFGWRRALLIGGLVLPAIFFAIGGRQTKISADEDTAMTRIEYWYQGIQMMIRSPVLGIGVGRFAEEVGQVAHNSFVQAGAELGLPGGMCFFGIYYLPFWSLRRLNPARVVILDPELGRLRPYLLGILVGYFVSLMTISRNAVIPSYMIPGIVITYLGLIEGEARDAIPRASYRTAIHLALVFGGFMVALYLLVRFTISK